MEWGKLFKLRSLTELHGTTFICITLSFDWDPVLASLTLSMFQNHTCSFLDNYSRIHQDEHRMSLFGIESHRRKSFNQLKAVKNSVSGA